ncbi:MAG: hypothetical protein OSB69_23370 [Alphaproteobacteria bacterium]|nr:hypothetical protein [Alphaproteobacteria bacterium]
MSLIGDVLGFVDEVYSELLEQEKLTLKRFLETETLAGLIYNAAWELLLENISHEKPAPFKNPKSSHLTAMILNEST